MGQLGFWDRQTGQWRQLADRLRIGYIDNFIEYNPVHRVMLFGGGNDFPRDLYKLDASGAVTKLRDAPIALGVTFTVVSVDPASGKYLVLAPGGLHEYDIVADTWSAISSPVPSVLMPPDDGLIEAPVTTHGVVMYVKYLFGGSKVYLYKHSQSSGTPLPVVTIAATDSAASEAGLDAGALTVMRTGSTSAPLTVSYSVSGSATPGTDYAGLPGSVTLPAGSASATIAVTPLDDAAVEPSETVVVTLGPGSGYAVGSPAAATVTVADDDSPDSDGDGLADAWEMQNFGTLGRDGTGDFDGDGATDAQEYAAGTDPLDPLSPPPGGGASPSGDGDGGCGLTGLEALLLLGILRRGAKRPWTTPPS